MCIMGKLYVHRQGEFSYDTSTRLIGSWRKGWIYRRRSWRRRGGGWSKRRCGKIPSEVAWDVNEATRSMNEALYPFLQFDFLLFTSYSHASLILVFPISAFSIDAYFVVGLS